MKKPFPKIRFFLRKVVCPYNRHWDGICYDTFAIKNEKLRKCDRKTCCLNCFDGKIE